MINNVKIIQKGPTHAELYIDDTQLKALVSYQINASFTNSQTITIVMLANIEIENKEEDKV